MRAICSLAIILLAACPARAATPPLELTPEPGLTLRLREKSVTATGPESFTWRGRIEGDPLSSATFLVSGATQIGIVRARERAWIVRVDAAGAVSIEEKAPGEESEGDDVVVLNPPDPSAPRAAEPSTAGTPAETPAGTPADAPADDGYLDDVPELESACGADIASPWISNALEAGGRGVLTRICPPPHPGRDSTYNVVVVGQAVGGMAFAHEVGHNLGCMHDRANSGYAGAFPYSYGYIEPRCRFRTIMAYGTCPRIANYSNPDIDSGGRPTGVALGDPEEAHDALSLNGTVPTVAN